jgi:hypothetical protein
VIFSAFPAIERVDLRTERGPTMTLTNNIADLAWCGAAIGGGNPRRLEQSDRRGRRESTHERKEHR